jgi:hypothetical protein
MKFRYRLYDLQARTNPSTISVKRKAFQGGNSGVRSAATAVAAASPRPAAAETPLRIRKC